MTEDDTIHIRGLRTAVRIGVTELERARWQTLELDVDVIPANGFAEMGDDLEQTINYSQLSLDLRDLAAERPRQLLETLIEELAVHVLRSYPAREVGLTVKKFIVPGTEWVGVSVRRRKED